MSRTLRGRRGAAAAAATAAVLLGAGGCGGDGGATVAEDPAGQRGAASSTGGADERAAAASAPEDGALPATYDESGELVVAPGAEVHRTITNPFGFEPGQGVTSDALDLTVEGQRTWVVLEGVPGDHSTLMAAPGGTWATFEEYVDSVVTHSSAPWPTLVRLTPGGEVAAAGGVQVVDRTDDPQLGDSFAPQGTLQGAAVVAAEDGYTYFVVWRELDPGTLDVIPVIAGSGADLTTVLAWAREKYASGVGLR